MSFILDALRKSESERQQDMRPNVARIPDAVPARRVPAWALVTIAGLAAGVVGLGLAWWQTVRPPASSASAAPAQPSPAPADPAAARVSSAATGGGTDASAASSGLVDSPGSTPVPIPPQGALPSTTQRLGSAERDTSVRVARTTLREAAAEGRTADGGAGGPRAAASGTAPRPSARTAAVPEIDENIRRYASSGGLPALRLELHAYDSSPARRFVFINGARYVEGDRLAEGPQLVAITSDGAVVLADGQQLLLRQE